MRTLADAGYLGVNHVASGQQLALGIPLVILVEREACALQEPPFQLPGCQIRVDDRAAVAAHRSPHRAHQAGPRVHLDLDEDGDVSRRAVDRPVTLHSGNSLPTLAPAAGGDFPDSHPSFRYRRGVDNALSQFLVEFYRQRIRHHVQIMGSRLQQFLSHPHRSLHSSAATDIDAPRGVSADIVDRRAGLGRGEVDFV